ncbi:MAG: nitrite reductase small subunit NirD [Deltaproteobacteria bacterium]|nr:nitrite reductase small subunit NirD [Deltaproteobacteria bacterium]
MEGNESEEAFTIVVVGNGMVGHRFCERLAGLRRVKPLRVVVFGEEPRAAYDRVHLSAFFSGRSADELALTDPSWYAEQSFELHLGDKISALDRKRRVVSSRKGLRVRYDALVLATGSESFVPPILGIETAGVFGYRTIEDLEAITAWAARSETVHAAVIGGGLLGLEAAKAAVDLGLETHVVEFADRLMPRQLDEEGAALLSRAIESLGVHVHTGMRTEAILGDACVTGMRFADHPALDVDMVLVSAGIRPRDELARQAGLEVAERGGIIVDDTLATSDPRIFAIGECARHAGTVYGLVGPGYEMADVLARRLDEEDARFTGADLSAKLKLMGVDVASFGEPFADAEGIAARRVVIEDRVAGVYQKLAVTADGARLLGGILVGDTEPYASLVRNMRERAPVPPRPHQLLTGIPDARSDTGNLPDEAQICSCSNVSKGDILAAIQEHELSSIAQVKSHTKAGSGCGGCLPLVTQIFEAEQARAGHEVSRNLCEHFDYTREELFQIVKLGRIRSFDALLSSHGRGDGCEICRPSVASILASTWNELVIDHATIQDTNDRYLANIQRGGSYSVVPRVPGGEITPQKLAVLARVAENYDLYCKFTGAQRIDLFGAGVEQLPDIWEELVEAGFESGHAYGKSMRTVKSCVGSTWCRFGVGDSTGFAIRIEERYRGLRGPHKIKGAVSGCIRECAEAQNKDFGIIATEKGWNLYLCGNGGSNPRHGDLFATDLDDDAVIRTIDRFLMYYIQTAKPLQRTARWLEGLEGGIEYLKSVVIDDSLGICAQLEEDMQQWIDSYRCEWAQVVRDPERRAWFRHYASSGDADESLEFVRERGQKRPAAWPQSEDTAEARPLSPEEDWSWTPLGRVEDFPKDGGKAVRYGATQLAIYRFESRGEWYASQNACPHRGDNVLARGLLGSQSGEPKVACPVHKKTFSLTTGKGLSDPAFHILTFPVKVSGGEVFVKLPDPETLSSALHRCAGQTQTRR